MKLRRVLFVPHGNYRGTETSDRILTAVKQLLGSRAAVQSIDQIGTESLLKVYKNASAVRDWMSANYDVCVLLEADEFLSDSQYRIATAFVGRNRNLYVFRNRELRKVESIDLTGDSIDSKFAKAKVAGG